MGFSTGFPPERVGRGPHLAEYNSQNEHSSFHLGVPGLAKVGSSSKPRTSPSESQSCFYIDLVDGPQVLVFRFSVRADAGHPPWFLEQPDGLRILGGVTLLEDSLVPCRHELFQIILWLLQCPFQVNVSPPMCGGISGCASKDSIPSGEVRDCHSRHRWRLSAVIL